MGFAPFSGKLQKAQILPPENFFGFILKNFMIEIRINFKYF